MNNCIDCAQLLKTLCIESYSMSKSEEVIEQFALPPQMAWLAVFGMAFFSILFVMINQSVFFSEKKAVTLTEFLKDDLVYVLISAVFVFLCGSFLKSVLFGNISIDQHGFWYSHKRRDVGIVLWEKVFSTKEHPLMQCMDLLDVNGSRIFRIENQLVGFERLRALVIERCNISSQFIQANYPCVYKRHVTFTYAYALFFWLLVAYLHWDSPRHVGTGTLVFLAIATLFYIVLSIRGTQKLEVYEDKIITYSSVKQTVIPISSIVSIELLDTLPSNHSRHPRIVLKLSNDSYLALGGLHTISCTDLYVQLICLKEKVRLSSPENNLYVNNET